MSADDKRAEWAEAAQAELDKPLHPSRPKRLPKQPTAKDLIEFTYSEMAKFAGQDKPGSALRRVK